MLDLKEVFSVSRILFSVIDILRMVVVLFLGVSILQLFGLDIASFAVAGSIVIFIVALEMILGINLIKDDADAKGSGSIVPLAFPLIASAGILITILSLRAVYGEIDILIGIPLNCIFVYLVLRSSVWLERVIGKSGFAVFRRVFGVMLLAMAVKIFKTHAL
jgi:multiple antibiotic resistance protein